MAPVNANYRVKCVVLDDGTPVALVAPIDANFVVMRNVGQTTVKVISDLDDPTAWDDIAPGIQNTVGGMKIVSFTGQPFPVLAAPLRFVRGSTVCFLQAPEQGGEIRVQFVL